MKSNQYIRTCIIYYISISTCYFKLNLNIINVSNTDILFIILPKVSFHLFINPYFARYLVIHIILLYLTC
jgi:hypothetical protein